MTGRKYDEEQEQEVYLWLYRRGVTIQNYISLPDRCNKLLRDRVSPSSRVASYGQLRELYQKLCPGQTRGGTCSLDPADDMSNEGLQEFFSPLTNDEKYRDPYQWVDWGGE